METVDCEHLVLEKVDDRYVCAAPSCGFPVTQVLECELENITLDKAILVHRLKQVRKTLDFLLNHEITWSGLPMTKEEIGDND